MSGTPTKPRPPRSLIKLVLDYWPHMPSEIRASAVLAGLAPAALPVSEAAATGPADPAAWKCVKIRDTRSYPDRPVFWATVDVFDAPFSPSAKLVDLALTAAMSGHPEQVRVPVQRLAEMTGLPEAEVQCAVAELLAAGRFSLDPRRAQRVGDHGADGGGPNG